LPALEGTALRLEQILTTGAEEFGIHLSKEQVERFFLYLSELRKWNRKINLTAIREDRDIVIKHFLDSLSLVGVFTPQEGMKLLDMGSGAGFPALPLKMVYPGLSVTLVESVKKKASFLRHIIRTLRLDGVVVVDKRIEELPSELVSPFDVVTARAFREMEATILTGAPFLKNNGLMVLSRGPEETVGDEALAKAGVTLERKEMLTLPCSDYQRAIWVFSKAG